MTNLSYYKDNAEYYRYILGIAHFNLGLIGIVTAKENLTDEEKVVEIKRLVVDYKTRRKNQTIL